MNAGDQFWGGDRLDDIVVGAGFQAGDTGGGLVVGGDDDHAAIAVGGEALDQFDAVEVGQFEVDQGDIGVEAVLAGEGVGAGERVLHVEASRQQRRLHRGGDGGDILDQQHLHAGL